MASQSATSWPLPWVLLASIVLDGEVLLDFETTLWLGEMVHKTALAGLVIVGVVGRLIGAEEPEGTGGVSSSEQEV